VAAAGDEARGHATAYAFLIVLSVFCLLPFFWVFLSAIDPDAGQFLQWPKGVTAEHFSAIFSRENGGRWFFNSLVVVGGATALVVVVAGLGGYALSRTHAWWKRPFLYAIILVRVLPPTALLVPLYKVMLTANASVSALVRALVPGDLVRPTMKMFGFVDGYLGLILAMAAMQLPLALWIIKTFFDQVPRDYEEAALMDGATVLQRIRRVLVPLALPGLGAAALLTFIAAWGDFLLPLTFISSAELQLLPIGLFRAYLRVDSVDYGFLCALALLYTAPAVIAFGFARRFLVMTFAGGVKG
jgi:multiple sugar transport system permease protein